MSAGYKLLEAANMPPGRERDSLMREAKAQQQREFSAYVRGEVAAGRRARLLFIEAELQRGEWNPLAYNNGRKS